MNQEPAIGPRQAVRRACRQVERAAERTEKAARRAERAARALAQIGPELARAGASLDSPKQKDWTALARSLARLRAAEERVEAWARLSRESAASWPVASEVAAERHAVRPLRVEARPRDDDQRQFPRPTGYYHACPWHSLRVRRGRLHFSGRAWAGGA